MLPQGIWFGKWQGLVGWVPLRLKGAPSLHMQGHNENSIALPVYHEYENESTFP